MGATKEVVASSISGVTDTSDLTSNTFIREAALERERVAAMTLTAGEFCVFGQSDEENE